MTSRNDSRCDERPHSSRHSCVIGGELIESGGNDASGGVYIDESVLDESRDDYDYAKAQSAGLWI